MGSCLAPAPSPIDKALNKYHEVLRSRGLKETTHPKRLNCSIFDGISRCNFVKPLVEVMENYRKLQMLNEPDPRDHDSLYSYVLDPRWLDSENLVRIMDYYFHALSEHDRDSHFNFIYEQLRACDVSNCHKVKRNYRDKMERNIGHVYSRSLSLEKRVFIEIMDKIHCYFYHSFDGGYRIKSTESEQKNELRPFPRRGTDSEGHNRFTMSHIDLKDIGGVKMYCYGYAFVYNVGVNNDPVCPVSWKDKTLLYIKPKYASLKEEITTNAISPIPIDLFNLELQKAQNHANSNCGKRKTALVLPFRNGSQRPSILEQLLCFMIYCNYDHYQCAFTKTYRENGGKDHVNFFHFASAIESAQTHTKLVTPEKSGGVHSFYHGIGEQLVLPFAKNGVRVMSPLSTSSQLAIAARFTDQNTGIVVEFASNNDACSYFSLSWLSNYPGEREYLFMQCIQYNVAAHLKMNNITNAHTGFEYNDILDMLAYIDAHLFTNAFTINTKSITSKINEFLSNVVIVALSEQSNDDVLDKYSKEMIKGYFQTSTKIKLSLQNWMHCGNVLASVVPSNSHSGMFSLDFIFLWFSNMEELTVTIDKWDVSLWNEMVSKLEKYEKSKCQKIWINVIDNDDDDDDDDDDKTLFNIVDEYSVKLRELLIPMYPVFAQSKTPYMKLLPGYHGNMYATYNIDDDEKQEMTCSDNAMKSMGILRMTQFEVVRFMLKMDRMLYFKDHNDELMLLLFRLCFDDQEFKTLNLENMQKEKDENDEVKLRSEAVARVAQLLQLNQTAGRDEFARGITKLHIFPNSLLVKSFQYKSKKYDEIPLLDINQYFTNTQVMCIHDFELSQSMVGSIFLCIEETEGLRTICIMTGKYMICPDFVYENKSKAKELGFTFDLESYNVLVMARVYVTKKAVWKHDFELPLSQFVNP